MASEDEDTADEQASKAIAEWARKIAAAGPWGPTWSELSELERNVVTLIHNAAVTLSLLREGVADSRDRAWLEGLLAVPARGTWAQHAAAVRIVIECAEQRAPLVSGVADRGAIGWDRICVALLAAQVDARFAALQRGKVAALLGSYRPRGSGLNQASRIVVELYKLIGFSVTFDAVKKAAQRALAEE